MMAGNRPTLSPEAFDRVIEQAIARIPEEIRRYLANVVFSVQPRPSPELLAEMGFPPDEVLFGYFSGIPLTERSIADPPLFPDTIYIFQEPLEDYCRNRQELIEEIEITVVHEIAHFVGFDEGQLEELGYG
jgi:predicted Zn-dependent protease with MMP-like domain